ncbi:hypothetical protein O6H91_21G070500 [Diphasiastrum complanatum]|uniref:Uncharacterized protein n=2 Tax=Diphasiastrum complanatum TaxID=34168 RepID=A0ACC2ALP5_DIPCM|nr:hypothetical protein O6H91_21G069300 [Diphasiastrum complanatum]KAJ7518470.1 hypothetical protein O6H91_21G070500 [Diphasiastrum complanatum]
MMDRDRSRIRSCGHTTTSSSESLEIRDARLVWGKWYQYPDKNKEISAPNGTIINPGSPVTIASCGRQNASSGTEGSFNLYAKPSDRKIATVSWDCPLSGSNVLSVTSLTNDYLVQNSSYTPCEIGHIHINVAKFG